MSIFSKFILAIDVAFCKPERVTFAGSTTLLHYKCFFCSIIAYFKFLLNFFNNNAPFIPAFSAIRRNGAKIAREIIIAPISSSSLNYFFAHVTRFLINELRLLLHLEQFLLLQQLGVNCIF
jgi:hypothetical protein